MSEEFGLHWRAPPFPKLGGAGESSQCFRGVFCDVSWCAKQWVSQIKQGGLELAPKGLVGDLLEQATLSIGHHDIRLSGVTAALGRLPEGSRWAVASPVRGNTRSSQGGGWWSLTNVYFSPGCDRHKPDQGNLRKWPRRGEKWVPVAS